MPGGPNPGSASDESPFGRAIAREQIAARPSHPTLAWTPLKRPAAWAVIDLETTGLFPKVDRIVEIAIVRLSPNGAELDAWTTMVNPQRDLGDTDVHGIFASDVRGAPTFGEIADEVAARVGGARVAAHNARFDIDFVAADMARAGRRWQRPEAFCTMVVPHRLGVTHSRRLDACCVELGISFERSHTALSDARASTGILLRALNAPGVAVPAPAPDAPDPAFAARPKLRSEPPAPRIDTSLGQLSDRVGVPAGTGIGEDAALTYLGLLDRVLEDRHVSEHEVAALAETAAIWGISADSARALHLAYLSEMWTLARADGLVTVHEMHDLSLLAELLGVPLDAGPVVMAPSARPGGERLAGKTVCFTGGSVVTIGGARLSRSDQEVLAEQAGMIVFQGVTKGLDILVMADPDSQSGKAQKADRYGTRRMAEVAFWRAAGVEID